MNRYIAIANRQEYTWYCTTTTTAATSGQSNVRTDMHHPGWVAVHDGMRHEGQTLVIIFFYEGACQRVCEWRRRRTIPARWPGGGK